MICTFASTMGTRNTGQFHRTLHDCFSVVMCARRLTAETFEFSTPPDPTHEIDRLVAARVNSANVGTEKAARQMDKRSYTDTLNCVTAPCRPACDPVIHRHERSSRGSKALSTQLHAQLMDYL